MNEISGRSEDGFIRLLWFIVQGVALGKGAAHCLFRGLFALQCVQQLAKLIHGGLQIFHDILGQFFRGGQIV